MSGTGGNGRGPEERVSGARPLVLVRYRREVPGDQADGLVHFLALPPDGQAGAASALCGLLLRTEHIEIAPPGRGTPCTPCMVSHLATSSPPPPAPSPSLITADAAEAASTYQSWGWPIALRGDQVWLGLGREVLAAMLPALLAVTVTAILTDRRCPPAVLVHPDAPDRQVLLVSDPYPVRLPWPPDVHRISGALLLPPTPTPRGPLTWLHPPGPHTLHLCREVDLIAALRTARTDPPPTAF